MILAESLAGAADAIQSIEAARLHHAARPRGAAAWPLAARAQQAAMPVVGILRPTPKDVDQFVEPFRRYMRAIGWEDGRNVRFLFVWAEGRNERAPALAEQLIAQNVDVIVTF